jgi:hypothetical protein
MHLKRNLYPVAILQALLVDFQEAVGDWGTRGRWFASRCGLGGHLVVWPVPTSGASVPSSFTLPGTATLRGGREGGIGWRGRLGARQGGVREEVLTQRMLASYWMLATYWMSASYCMLASFWMLASYWLYTYLYMSTHLAYARLHSSVKRSCNKIRRTCIRNSR